MNCNTSRCSISSLVAWLDQQACTTDTDAPEPSREPGLGTRVTVPARQIAVNACHLFPSSEQLVMTNHDDTNNLCDLVMTNYYDSNNVYDPAMTVFFLQL